MDSKAKAKDPSVSGRRTGWNPPARQGDRGLEAALTLFDSVGYSAATIEDIRLQSEVSIGSIYHRFGSKEGIAGALYVESLRSYQQGLVRVLLESAGAEQGVRDAVGHHVR